MSTELCEGMDWNMSSSVDLSQYKVTYTVVPSERPPAKAGGEKPLKVNATETEIVEFFLGWHAAGIFPDLSQEALIERVRRFTGLPLKNWPHLAQNIRRRNSGLTFFDRLKDSLTDRNKEILELGHAPKRRKIN
ncbi:MAG TPA: hypothetical protein VFE32_04415 [Puia sp.]|nr:hypothetical protein [Puia sp.]